MEWHEKKIIVPEPPKWWERALYYGVIVYCLVIWVAVAILIARWLRW